MSDKEEIRKLKRSIANKKYYEKRKEKTTQETPSEPKPVLQPLLETEKPQTEFVELDENQLNELINKINPQKNPTAPSLWDNVKTQVFSSLILGGIPLIPRMIPLVIRLLCPRSQQPTNGSSAQPLPKFQNLEDPYQSLHL